MEHSIFFSADPNPRMYVAMKIIKCQKCGTEYEMPDGVLEAWATNCPPHSAVKPIMESCPVCQEIEKKMKELLNR